MKKQSNFNKFMKSKETKKMMKRFDKKQKEKIERIKNIPFYKKALIFNWIGLKKFERIIQVSPPFDKRNSNPKKNYGIGAMGIKFILKGRKGAVQIVLSTHYYPAKVMDSYIEKKGYNPFRWAYDNKLKDTFDCWDVGYHSIKKPYYLEKSDGMICDLNDCGYCYYDGSSLRGSDDKISELFMEKGEKGIWEYLEKYYKEVFKNRTPSGFGLMIKMLPYALSKKLNGKSKNGKKNT